MRTRKKERGGNRNMNKGQSVRQPEPLCVVLCTIVYEVCMYVCMGYGGA